MTEILGEPYPQEEWGTRVALDFFLGGTGSGLAALYLINLIAFGESRDLGVGVSAFSALLVLSGVALLGSELGRPSNLWRSAARFRTSWLARGSVFSLVLLVALGLVAGSFAVQASAPSVLPLYLVAAILSLMVAAYPGMLLHSIKDIGSWRSSVQPLLSLLQAVSTGSSVLVLATIAAGGPLGDVTAEALLVCALCLLLSMSYLVSLRKSGSEGAGAAYTKLKSVGGFPAYFIFTFSYGLPLAFFLSILALPGTQGLQVLAVAGAALVLAMGLGYRMKLLRTGFHEPLTILRQRDSERIQRAA